MALPDSQRKVAQFVEAHGLENEIPARLLDLASEVGELAKEALKGSHYGREPFRPTEEWAGEVGDVLFSLICVANSSGIDLEGTLDETLEKYERRLAQAGNAGSGR